MKCPLQHIAGLPCDLAQQGADRAPGLYIVHFAALSARMEGRRRMSVPAALAAAAEELDPEPEAAAAAVAALPPEDVVAAALLAAALPPARKPPVSEHAASCNAAVKVACRKTGTQWATTLLYAVWKLGLAIRPYIWPSKTDINIPELAADELAAAPPPPPPPPAALLPPAADEPRSSRPAPNSAYHFSATTTIETVELGRRDKVC